ncbi:hypothetical protein NQ315_007018 [Exocentrus adspersus]|uniref:Uncharacterized protein n=1 Tax=Exocentrus adspersus TaxID=1586481 RepID=A0AAV8WC86_9CUCU|nr:hypothetical protein NQ315_007018 [Exocentrus adspersus]
MSLRNNRIRQKHPIGQANKSQRANRTSKNPESLFERDRTGKTALHYCCTSDSLCASHAADVLVMAAPDLVEGRDEDGFTPLHLAVIAGNMQLVTFLLANNADVNAVDNEKHTVVHWATESMVFSRAAAFLEYKLIYTPIPQCVGETAALRDVLSAGAPASTPDVHGGYPLHYAAQMCGGTSNDRDSTFGMQVLHTLLSHKDISVSVTDNDQRQPLLWAASAGSARAVLALVRAGAAVEAADKDGLTALHCAASRGTHRLLGHVADALRCLAGCDRQQRVHGVALCGHADATALLLAHGADPNRQDRKGRSPAHCGCAKGQFETLKMLGTQHGANLWLRNARGDLPLHEAAAAGRRELVLWLLGMRPSQANARNNDGRCPLHMAALNDNVDMCKILLDAGAQVNPVLRTSRNIFMTPLDCALQRGFRSTAKFLQLHGGVPASRLAELRNNPASALHIRDDVTFLGDSSSESENGQEDLVKKSHRKKAFQKLETAKISATASEEEFEKVQTGKVEGTEPPKKKSLDKTKPSTRNNASPPVPSKQSETPPKQNGSKKLSSSRLEYTNEIIINGRTEINIHQTREIILDKEPVLVDKVTETVSSQTAAAPASASSLRRPKSAKTSKAKDRLGKGSASKEPAKSRSITSPETIIQQDKASRPPSLRTQSTNTSEDTVIENVNFQPSTTAESTKLVNQQSLVSNTSEDVEDHKDFVVEASVHEPPKSHLEANVEEQATVVTTEGVDGEKCSPTKEQEKAVAAEAVINTDTAGAELRKSPDGQTVEGDVETDTQHQAEAKSDDVESETRKGVDKTDKNVSSNQTTGEEAKITSGEAVDQLQENQTLTETQAVKQETKLDESEVNVNDIKEVDKELVEESEDRVEEETDTTEKGQTKDEAVAEETSKIDGTSTTETEEAVDKAVKANGIDKETVPESVEAGKSNVDGKQMKRLEDSVNETEPAVKVAVEKGQGNENEVTKKRVTKQKDVQHKHKVVTSNEQRKIKVGESKNKEHSKLDKSNRSKKLKENEDYSDEDYSSTSEDGSLSTPTRKAHKSFRVLDEGEIESTKSNKGKRKEKKESRSRSEENKKKASGKDRNKKRSKIPTPLGSTALSKSDKHLDKSHLSEKRAVQKVLEGRVPSLPNIYQDKNRLKEPLRSESNMSAPLLASPYSDNESMSDVEHDPRSLVARSKKRVKKKSKTREARSAGSDYESSNLIDSGFEPSPRSTRIPKWRNMSDRGVNMTSVTQNIQGNIRRYHLERKIFQQLLELKRLQIRAGQHNETVLVKRAIDAYHQSCASTVGAGRYIPEDFSFKSFEKFLYESLRKLQKTDVEHIKGLPEAPMPRVDHHTIPKIGYNDVNCKPGTGFLPHINSKKAVTLELSHGTDKQVISLPTDRLDQNKRYYVTFTVKGHDPSSSNGEEGLTKNGHIHSKSD